MVFRPLTPPGHAKKRNMFERISVQTKNTLAVRNGVPRPVWRDTE
jgi:hypothetical protein